MRMKERADHFANTSRACRTGLGDTPRRIPTLTLSAAALLAGSVAPSLVMAEVMPVNTLGRAGGTDLQIRTGNAVQAVCGQFIAANNEGTPPADALEADLFDKCGEMVHTARVVTGEEGPTGKSLDLTAEELQAALQNIAGEEGAATGSMATESTGSQLSNVSKRLSALLSRSSTLTLSAVNLFGSDALYAYSAEVDGDLSGAGAGEGDLTDNRWGVFINGDFGSGEKDGTDGEDGFEYDAAGFTVGADYRMNEQVVLGLAVGFNSSESDFDTTANVSGGGLDTEATSFSTYGLFYTDNYYFDGILTIGQTTIDMERSIEIASNTDATDPNGNPNDGASRSAESETDSDQIAFSFGGGTDIRSGSFTFAPYLRAQYLKVDVDAFEESGTEGLNLRFEEQEIESITTALGFRASTVANTGFGVLVPQAHLEWIHEYSDDEREVTTVYIHDPRQNELLFETDSPDRDYFTMGLGLSSVFRGGTQAFIDVRTLMGLTDFTETGVTAGVRFEL